MSSYLNNDTTTSSSSIDFNLNNLTGGNNVSSFFDTEVEQRDTIDKGNVYYKLKSKAFGVDESIESKRKRAQSLGELPVENNSSDRSSNNNNSNSGRNNNHHHHYGNIVESPAEDSYSLLRVSSRENVDIENLKNEEIDLDDSPIGWYRVIQHGGVILRTDIDLLEGSWVTRLPYNSTVYVTLQRGQRISLSKPIYGWASLENHDGEKLFEKLHQDSREPSPDVDISPYLKIQKKWSKRSSTMSRNNLSICSLASRASTISVGRKSFMNDVDTICETSSNMDLEPICEMDSINGTSDTTSNRHQMIRVLTGITPTVLEEFSFPDSDIKIRTKKKSRNAPPAIMMSHSTIDYKIPAQSFTIDKDQITLKEINIKSRKETDLQEVSVTYFGPNSTVYLVNHKVTQKKYALKALDVSQSIHRKEIVHEFKTLKTYKHKNIVELFDIHWSPKYSAVCFLLEWMDQGSLHEILKTHGPLPNDRILSISKDVLCGLEYLHGFGCIHNDIKPANILLHNGVAKISDFGISRNINDTNKELIQSGTFIYMSPERLEGKDYNMSADIWSFGLLLYELIKGISFYDSDLNMAVIVSIVCSGDLPDLSNEENGIIRDMINKCCVREKSSRITASELIKMLTLHK